MVHKTRKPKGRPQKQAHPFECDICHRPDCPTPINTKLSQDVGKRFCEADECHVQADTSDMIQISDAWYCPDHAAELNRLCVVVGHIIVDPSVDVTQLADEVFEELERFEGVLEALGVMIHSIKEPEHFPFRFETRAVEKQLLYANRGRSKPRWPKNTPPNNETARNGLTRKSGLDS